MTIIMCWPVVGLHAADNASVGESICCDPGQGVPCHCGGDPQPARDAACVLPEQASILQHV